MLASFALALCALAALQSSVVCAHMMMSDPPPLRSQYNKYATNADYDMTSPLTSDGSNYPCKGYLDDTSGKDPVATWKAGSSQTVTYVRSPSLREEHADEMGAALKEVPTMEVVPASFPYPKTTVPRSKSSSPLKADALPQVPTSSALISPPTYPLALGSSLGLGTTRLGTGSST